MLFVDDMILFTEAFTNQMAVVNKCLDKFCEQSGQKVSVVKTKICFSNNVETSLAKSISDMSGYTRYNNLGKYLGVPLLHNIISFSTYIYVLEKIQNRLSG